MNELRPPTQRVSPRAPYLWALGAAVGVIVPPVVAGTAAFIAQYDVPWWAWPLYAVSAIGYVVAMPMVRYRVHRWETTETAVYTQTGWLGREQRVAPMARVQTVDFAQGPVERLFGLASVTVTTASAAGPLSIAAIDEPLARRLVDDLTVRAGSGDDAT